MPHSSSKNLGPLTIALALAALACLGVAACGSSSSGSSSSTSTPTAAKTTAEATTTTPESTTPTTTTSPEASTAHRRLLAAAVAKCLRSHGAQVAEPSAEGFLKIEGPATRTPQFHAAVKKCHSVIAEAFAGVSKK